MSAADLDEFWVHTITVETYGGEAGSTTLYADPVTVPCFIDGGQKVTRATTGEILVVAAPVYAPISAADVLVPKSKVTIRGRAAQIVAATVHDSGDMDLPDHVEVTLT
jgi:hypothetical protein